MDNSQSLLHLLECTLGLLEEPIDNTLAEVAIVVVVVHFENLFKSRLVDGVGHVGELRRALLGLRLRELITIAAELGAVEYVQFPLSWWKKEPWWAGGGGSGGGGG